MTALAAERRTSVETWRFHKFTLTSGTKAYKNGAAGLDKATGNVKPMVAGGNLLYIGKFDETVDATSAAKPVRVDLLREIDLAWFANDSGAGNVLAASDAGNLCYWKDDQTVSKNGDGRSRCGRVWAVTTADGVLVEKLQAPEPPILDVQTAPAFASNDMVIGNNPPNGGVYELVATAAASTVTLPATAVERTRLVFLADGTLNGHTVQYRDATGPTNITAALTASKRHVVECFFLNAKWRAIAHVSP